MTRGVWALAAVLVAAPAAAEIELPGCDAPPEVEAASALPAELTRRCGGDRSCWQEGLEQTRDLVARFETSYDAHRIRVLVARGARRALGAEAVAEVVASYRELAARHADHPGYRHLLAQLELEDGPYEAELERIATGSPDYPWAQLSIAYLLRPGAEPAARDRSLAALDRFVALCPSRLEPALAMLERLGDSEAWSRLRGRLRAAAIPARDFVAAERLWRLGERFETDTEDGHARWLAGVREDLERLVASGLPAELPALEALSRGYGLIGDVAGIARTEESLLERHRCSGPARSLLANRLRPRLADAIWVGVERRRAIVAEVHRELEALVAECGEDERSLALDVEALALLGPDAGAALPAAVERWLAVAGGRHREPELWAAERLVEAGVGLDRAATLLETARALRAGPGASAGAPADGGRSERTELRLAAALALAAGEIEGARRRIEELRAAVGTSDSGALGAEERVALERIEAGWACATEPGEAALERWGALVATAPEAGAVERDARRCWLATRGTADGFDAWRDGITRVERVATGWRTVDEPIPAAELTDLGRAPLDAAARAGKTLVLRAWAGWCAPCREELAALGELARRFEDRPDVVIRLVNVGDDPSPVIDLLARDALAVEPLFGGAALLESGFLERVPAAWIVAPDGRVVRRQDGPVGDAAAWVDATAAVIAEVAGPRPAAAPVVAP